MNTARWMGIAVACGTLALGTGCSGGMSDEEGVPTEQSTEALTSTLFMSKNCEDWQLNVLRNAAGAAVDTLRQKRTNSAYVRWFGPLSGALGDMKSFVDLQSVYIQESVWNIGAAARHALAKTNAQTITIDCAGGRNSIAAHVLDGDVGRPGGTVFIDNPFWSLDTHGQDSQPGVLIHEISHIWGAHDFNTDASGFTDFDYALALAQIANNSLAQGDKTTASQFQWGALLNANNYEFFYENQ